MANMLATLKDGHVRLLAPFDSATYQGYYKQYAPNFNFTLVKQRYLKNDYLLFDSLIYKVVDSVGYVYCGSFQNDISDNKLDSLFKLIGKTKGLIIDIRNNAGGNSSNSNKLFRQFIANRKLVKYEKGKKGPGRFEFLDPEPFYLDPGSHYYSKKVCLLTNRTCFSAANDFALYMSGISNVTLVGDQTGGGGGIPYDVQLANGWKLQYTATVTLSPQKQQIETGIRPDIPLQITSIDEANGRDPIIEKGFEILK
jgi:C-terminal processing protease CtpA/Prc